jgi:hypothetical protein
VAAVGRATGVHHQRVELHEHLVRGFQVLAEIEGEGELDELADFAEGVGEALELEGDDLRDGVKEEAFAGVGALLAVLAEVLVVSLQLVDCEEAADALQQRVGTLTFLTLYPDFVRY